MNPRFNSSSFPQSAVKTAALLQTHGVNNAQAVKHGVVWGRQSGNAAQGAIENVARKEEMEVYEVYTFDSK